MGTPNLLERDEAVRGEVRTYHHLWYTAGMHDGGFGGYYSTRERAVRAAKRHGLVKYLSDPNDLGCQIDLVRVFTVDGKKGFVMGEESKSPIELDKGKWDRPWF